MGTTDEIFQLATIRNGKVEETAPQIIIPIALQKRICYFGSCISHQSCNCWHGFMGWY